LIPSILPGNRSFRTGKDFQEIIQNCRIRDPPLAWWWFKAAITATFEIYWHC